MDHTGFGPSSQWCVLSRSALFHYTVDPDNTAQAPGCSAGHCPKRALHCMHFPDLSSSGSDSKELHKGIDSVGQAFCALPRSKQFRCLVSELSQMGWVS